MKPEAIEVRMARIEEGISSLSKKVDQYHGQITQSILPIQQKQYLHQDDITTLKRDRFWLFTISGTALSGAIYAIIEKIVGVK